MTTDGSLVKLAGARVEQAGRIVLDEVDLELAEGEFAYLIGRTGAGKTSLLKTLYAQLPLRTGRGLVAGFDLRRIGRRRIPLLRRELGIVFQDFNLLDDRDATANLRFVLEATGWRDASAMANRIGEVLTQTELLDKATEMPRRMSGGERQRLVLARALLNTPRLLIADEPTGNLDPETADDVMQVILRLARQYGTAVLFATHDYRILEQFPARVFRCRGGRVLDERDLHLL